MPIEIFKSKEDALQTMMTKIYLTLKERGVPDVRLPEPQHLISHIMLWVDEEKMNKWIDGFASLETLKGSAPEKVVGTTSPANEVLTQTGTQVLQAGEKAKEVAGNILNAVKKAVVGQVT